MTVQGMMQQEHPPFSSPQSRQGVLMGFGLMIEAVLEQVPPGIFVWLSICSWRRTEVCGGAGGMLDGGFDM